MPAPLAHLSGFRPLDVGPVVAQRDGAAWLVAALDRAAPDSPERRRARRLYTAMGANGSIDARATVLDDHTHTDWGAMALYRERPDDPRATPWHRAPLEDRVAVFADVALRAAHDAFPDGEPPPDVLIQVSCTGYDAPTAAQRLALERGWDGVRLLHLGHMGCYAAVPAATTAAGLVAALAQTGRADARASVLHVEACTLHLDPSSTDTDRVVQNLIFADGAVRFDVTAAPRAGGFALLDHVEALVPDSLGAMTWRVADAGFDMTLSRRVPALIGQHVAGVVAPFLARHGLRVPDVAWWAVHPGGPSVVEAAAEALGLPEAAVRHSRAVLRARGNMSSATLPHIWHAMADDPAVRDGDLVVSLAFGPGLTVAGNLLRRGA